jgi:hypothetical protein
MLSRPIRKAVEAGTFEIYPVQNIWQAFYLATGVELGCRSIYDKAFLPKSALAVIDKKLKALHKSHRHHEK